MSRGPKQEELSPSRFPYLRTRMQIDYLASRLTVKPVATSFYITWGYLKVWDKIRQHLSDQVSIALFDNQTV